MSVALHENREFSSATRRGIVEAERRMKKALLMLVLLAVAIGVSGFAQGPPPPADSGAVEPGGAGPTTPQEQPPLPRLGSGRALHFFVFMGARRDWGRTVTGAPYSAEIITETTQTLSGGNRIDRKETGDVYRDSAGRTRQERTLSMIGPWVASGKPVKIVTIHDPVEGVDYVLNAAMKAAYKLPPSRHMPSGNRPESGMRPRRGEPSVPTSTESLGTKMIDGVKAEGTRKTAVIPAGKIGNEKPITIVSESWYSPELHVYILTKHDDPRFGDTTYRLVNIKLGEPPESLFRVPSGYAIRNAPPARFGQRPATRRQGSADPQ